MRKQLAFCAIILTAWATPLSADEGDIVYLRCTIGEGGDWKIALDERAKTITYEHSRARNVEPAVFTADKVMWARGDMVISRVDLSFSRTFLGKTDHGQCELDERPNRAF